MNHFLRLGLQFFAEGASGGEGGEGATQGVDESPAQNNLESLGIPKDKADRYAARKAARRAAMSSAEPEGGEPDNAAEPAQPASDPFDEFLRNPENNKRIQGIVNDRLKKYANSQENHKANLNALQPALEMLAQKYGLDATDGKLDYSALADAVVNDDAYYEDRAIELGTDVETAKKIENAERIERAEQLRKEQEAEAQKKAERDMQLREHFNKLQAQASDLQKLYPDFDLSKELENPRFFQATGIDGGYSVAEAFYAEHFQDLLNRQAEVISKRVTEEVANSVRSNRMRPRENGSNSAATLTQPNPRAMSKADRDALKARIRQAAARGEHLPLGG